MQGLVGEEEDLISDSVFDREPVELQGESDDLPGFGACEEPSSRVLDVLRPGQGLVGGTDKGSTAVVQVGSNEGMDHCFSKGVGE